VLEKIVMKAVAGGADMADKGEPVGDCGEDKTAQTDEPDSI
jgi:hypothetical protein